MQLYVFFSIKAIPADTPCIELDLWNLIKFASVRSNFMVIICAGKNERNDSVAMF